MKNCCHVIPPQEKLSEFILASQDECGGIADRPGDMVSFNSYFMKMQPHEFRYWHCLFQVDPFHTLFGVAGLSLIGEMQLKEVNPVFCMPQHVINRLEICPQILSV